MWKNGTFTIRRQFRRQWNHPESFLLDPIQPKALIPEKVNLHPIINQFFVELFVGIKRKRKICI